MTIRVGSIKKQPANAFSEANPTILGVRDMSISCERREEVEVITAVELEQAFLDDKEIQLIDVREPHEHAMASLGGTLIPLAQLGSHVGRLDPSKFTVIYCKSGIRSHHAVLQLQSVYKNMRCLNLKGGIQAYIHEKCKTNLRTGPQKVYE